MQILSLDLTGMWRPQMGERGRSRSERFSPDRPGSEQPVSSLYGIERGCTPLIILEPILQYCVSNDVDAACDAQFSHGVSLMGLDRLDAQVEPGGDLLIAVS